ncbi:MAG TPA: OmpA family protein [Chitinophagaceae bacterium]
MKRLLLFAVAYVLASSAEAQVLKNAVNRAKQRLEQKSNQKIDQAVDEAVDGKKKTNENTSSTNNDTEASNASNSEPSDNKENSGTQSIKTYSKFDFVPGDKIIYSDDFAQDVKGEFPVNWNTNGNGEVTTIDGLPGKWLRLQHGTEYESPFSTNLPENFTVEFDLLLDFDGNYVKPPINTLLFSQLKKDQYRGGKVEFTLWPSNGTSPTPDVAEYTSFDASGATHLNGKDHHFATFRDANHKKTPVHVAIWVQKQRFRVWINQDKLYDLPKGIAPDVVFNKLKFETGSFGGKPEDYKYFISNIKIAAAAPDTRTKLITEGKWTTSGILFDVSSDKIKPVSYGVLKEIAGVLTENTTVKVKIIGHTDNDGEEAANLDLSKRRAEAVKAALSSEFGIDAARMQTDGLGETKPVADNGKPEGKAQNRRVEFLKL